MKVSPLYQVRGIISKYVKKFEMFAKVLLKFAAFLYLFRTISGIEIFSGTGIFNSMSVHLVLALVATLLPSRIGVLIALALGIYNIFQASFVGAVLVGAMMLVLYISMARMFPDQLYFLVLIPICIQWNLYLLVPIFAGLYVGVIAVVPMVVGILMWGLIQIVPAFMGLEMSESLDALPKMISDASTYGIDQITKNEQMVYLLIISTAIVLTVSLLKKLRLDYAHYIAIGTGGILGIVCLIMGSTVEKVPGSLAVLISLGVVSVLAIALLEFFNLAVDHKSAQNLEFEDEEYFYQVRVIPKINPVSRTKKQIKTITQKEEMAGTEQQQPVPAPMPKRKPAPKRRPRPAEGGNTAANPNVKPLRREEGVKRVPVQQRPRPMLENKPVEAPLPAVQEKPRSKDDELNELFGEFDKPRQ